MNFDLVLDVPRPNDLIKKYGDVWIAVDSSSSIYIDEGMKVDYFPEKDQFKIISPNQILTRLYSL